MRPSVLIVLLVVAIALLSRDASAQEEQTFIFGISLALDAPPDQNFAQVQVETYQGMIIWKEWWNSLPKSARTMKNGNSFLVDFHIERFSNYGQSDTDRQGMFDTYARMAANKSIDYLFMPVGAPWNIELRNYTYYELGVPFVVAMADSSEAYYSVPGSFGTATANILRMTSYLPYLRVAKASKLAVVYVNETYQVELCYGVTSQAALNGLTVVSEHVMDFDYWTFGQVEGNPKREQSWNSVLDSIIEEDVDALFICDYGVASEYAVSYLKQKDWTPKSLTLTTLFDPWKDPSTLNYVTQLAQFDVNAHFPEQARFGNSADFDRRVKERFGVHATSNVATATLGGMIYSQALRDAKDNSSAAVSTALSTGQFVSFMGTSAFDTNSRQTLSSLAVQIMNNYTTMNVIGPALAAAETLIYPMPTWKERLYDPKWGDPTEIVAAVLMCVGGVVTLAWIVFLIKHWSHKVIVAASPLFLLAILVGSLLVYVSIFTWMPNLIDASICNTRAWLLPLGFMTMFGALLAKTYRIHRLYNAKGINILVIRNLQVALITMVIVVGQAVLSVLMITVTKLDSTVKIIDAHRPKYNYPVCTFSTALKVLLGINIGYAFVLLVWGSYLAYRIRKVPISIYDESKVIAFSIYNTCFFGIIVIVIQLAVGNSNRFLTFMITAVCCFLGAMITTGCLFGAKLWAIYKPQREYRSSGTLGTSSSGESRTRATSAGAGSVGSRDESRKLTSKYKKKYKAAKNASKDLKERIRQLEALARDHGFLQEQHIELSSISSPSSLQSTPATSPAVTPAVTRRGKGGKKSGEGKTPDEGSTPDTPATPAEASSSSGSS